MSIGAIIEATKGGVNGVFEASGASAAVASTLPLVRRGGALSFIGQINFIPNSEFLFPRYSLISLP